MYAVRGDLPASTMSPISNAALSMQLSQARSLAAGKKDESTEIADVEPHIDIVEPHIIKDPRQIPLKEKKRLADHYNDIVWSEPGIVSSDIIYGDNSRKVAFANSDGTYVEQEVVHVISRISAQARDGSDVQQAGFQHRKSRQLRCIRRPRRRRGERPLNELLACSKQNRLPVVNAP